MDLSFSEEQELLRRTARDFIASEYPISTVRKIIERTETAHCPELWQRMAELGWTGMAYPEAYGGLDATCVDLVALYEELGKGLLPTPHLSTSLLCGLTLLRRGSEAYKQELLPKISRGQIVLSLALTEPNYSWDPRSVRTSAAPQGREWTIVGQKAFVPHAHVADYLLCAVRTGDGGAPEFGVSLLLVPAKSRGVHIQPLSGFTGIPLCEIVLDNVKVPRENLVGEVHQGWAALADTFKTGIVALCAEIVGGAQAVYDMTVAYSHKRWQFGQPIGSFTRVQDRIIQMRMELDAARLATYEAAWSVAEGLPGEIPVSLAKAVCSRAYSRICLESHHIFAGTGFMKDADLYLYSSSAKATYHYLGDPFFHRKRIAQALKL